MKIISTTGTKGKTTITRVLSHVLYHSGNSTLRVDNDGHYVNEEQLSTLRDSERLFKKTPSVCPGKYLIEMKDEYPDFVAVLEASIGCAGEGLGYRFHDVGIFANVYEDHINPHKKIFNREDLARKKKFIIDRIKENGFLVFNADDKFICKEIEKSKKRLTEKKVKLIPVGREFNFFDHKKHLKEGGKIITTEDNFVVIKSQRDSKKTINIKSVSWTFEGEFAPSVYNLMLVVGGLYAFNEGEDIGDKQIEYIRKYQPVSEGGRLVRLKSKKGVTVLIDYAHEKYSLVEIGKLGNELKKNNLIGVLRLGPDLENHVISDIANAVAKLFDRFVVYDKIDGILRKKHSKRQAGEMAQMFGDEISKAANKKEVEKIIFEKDAIKRASEIAKKGDCVIVISGNDHEKTLEWVEEFFDIEGSFSNQGGLLRDLRKIIFRR